MLVLGQVIEKTLQVTIDPFVISDRPLLGLFDALSPTGREVAAIRPDPADSLGVLYVGQADAPAQAKMRQLARYDPPWRIGDGQGGAPWDVARCFRRCSQH